MALTTVLRTNVLHCDSVKIVTSSRKCSPSNGLFSNARSSQYMHGVQTQSDNVSYLFPILIFASCLLLIPIADCVFSLRNLRQRGTS